MENGFPAKIIERNMGIFQQAMFGETSSGTLHDLDVVLNTTPMLSPAENI